MKPCLTKDTLPRVVVKPRVKNPQCYCREAPSSDPYGCAANLLQRNNVPGSPYRAENQARAESAPSVLQGVNHVTASRALRRDRREKGRRTAARRKRTLISTAGSGRSRSRIAAYEMSMAAGIRKRIGSSQDLAVMRL
jgi:hypothetical protein